jgi:hypothetical protein
MALMSNLLILTPSLTVISKHNYTNLSMLQCTLRYLTLTIVYLMLQSLRELHFTDEAGIPIVILCYAQHGPVLGHKDFVLIANSTVVTMKCDINYHAKAPGSVGEVA